MKALLLSLLLCGSCWSAEFFKINQIVVHQIISDSEAICVRKNELVLISGLNFKDTGDNSIARSNSRGFYDGNYRYTTVLGSSKTIRKITIER